MGDQVDEPAKAEITEAIAEVRAALESDNVEEIKAKTDALQAAFHKVSEQIYSRPRPSSRPRTDGAGAGGGGREAEEEVVDAEVVDDERS